MTGDNAPKRFRYGKWRSLFYVLAAWAFIAPFAWFALTTETLWNQVGGWIVVALAAAVMLVMTRQAFDARPAIELRETGVYAARLNGEIRWDEIDAVWLRRTERRILRFIPLDTVELVVRTTPDAPFWRRGSPYRSFLRRLSRLSEDWTVAVSLNALAGGAPERVVEALRAVHPDRVGALEVKQANGRG